MLVIILIKNYYYDEYIQLLQYYRNIYNLSQSIVKLYITHIILVL